MFEEISCINGFFTHFTNAEKNPLYCLPVGRYTVLESICLFQLNKDS